MGGLVLVLVRWEGSNPHQDRHKAPTSSSPRPPVPTHGVAVHSYLNGIAIYRRHRRFIGPRSRQIRAEKSTPTNHRSLPGRSTSTLPPRAVVPLHIDAPR